MNDPIERQRVSDLFDAWEAAELDHHIPKILRDMLKVIPSAHPEPCEDAVSRQAVINIINKPVIIKAKEQIEALPSVQPEQRWIPVSERLPEDEHVLISKIPTKISGNKWSVAIAIRTADPRSRKIQWRDSGFGVIQDDKVLAWMPLPEPWKGDQE